MTRFLRFYLLGVLALLGGLAPIARADDPTNPHGQGGSGSTGVDLAALEKQLTGDGLTGWIHGAATEFEQYVFTWRDPNDFFVYQDFSIVPATAKVRLALKTVGRHDKVKIKGSFANNPSPQVHIVLTELEIVKKYDPSTSPTWPAGVTIPPYQHQTKLPADLLAKTEMLAVVHAAPANGGVLVVEYGDAVVPVFVESNAHTKDLYRGDKIKLHYRILKFPRKPTHLMLDTAVPKPIEMLDRMVEWHDRPITLEGALVYFPKSPQISFDVYAVQVVDSQGLKRNFTLVNLTDPQVFHAIRAKLEAVWTKNWSTVENGRNSYINRKIRVRATGIGNVISKAQANPQILLDSAEDITFLP